MRLLSLNINNSKKTVLMVRWAQEEIGLIIKSRGEKNNMQKTYSKKCNI